MYTGEQMTLQERLNAILPEVTSDGFLKRNKLSGEIPFYVFDYLPEDELKMREHILFMEERIKKHHPGIKFKHVRLFNLMIEHLTERGNIEKAYDLECKKGSAALWKALSAAVKPERFVNIIAEKFDLAQCDLVFISGTGTIWPWVRAHSLLNNLQSVTGNSSVVLFYPGKYSGQSFRLFDRLAENNYYRAFRLVP